jgi:hypothetical protein
MDQKEFIDQLINWEKFDAFANASERMNGVTNDIVLLEVELWQKQLELLTPLDHKMIRAEIDSWDIGIPSQDELNFKNVAQTYSKLVNYKIRISAWLSDAKAWKDVCDSAVRYIEELAMGAFSGSVAEKKSNALLVVQPFVHLKVETSRLENYLDKLHSTIVFSAQQLDLLLKERQSRAKLNLKLHNAGDGQD